jgi:hypothetical protein
VAPTGSVSILLTDQAVVLLRKVHYLTTAPFAPYAHREADEMTAYSRCVPTRFGVLIVLTSSV